MNIKEKLIKAGVEIGSHESDLYCIVNKKSTKIINQYKFKCNVTIFVNQITDKLWYDIPFAN